jgi:CRP/FNR family transcriptional regulator, cyclic AMP receptor protein
MDELSRIPIFQRLGTEELEKLQRIVARRRYDRGTVLFFEGDPSDSLYLILSGSVKVYQTSEAGREKILKILGPLEIVGELAMLDGQPRSATVAAMEDTETLSISRRDFGAFVAERPEFLWKVIESLCDRLRRTSDDMVDLSFRDVPYRLLRVLNQLCARYGEAAPEGLRIALKLGAKDLASMVGSNPETVSRLLARFQEDGLVRLERDHVLVPDPNALMRALEYASDWS